MVGERAGAGGGRLGMRVHVRVEMRLRVANGAPATAKALERKVLASPAHTAGKADHDGPSIIGERGRGSTPLRT